jgi:hypothetical protein
MASGFEVTNHSSTVSVTPSLLWPFSLGFLTPKSGFPVSRFWCSPDQPWWGPGWDIFSQTIFPPPAKPVFGEKGLLQYTWCLGTSLFATGCWGIAEMPSARINVHLILPFHFIGLGSFLAELFWQEAPRSGLQIEHGGPSIWVWVTAAAICHREKEGQCGQGCPRGGVTNDFSTSGGQATLPRVLERWEVRGLTLKTPAEQLFIPCVTPGSIHVHKGGFLLVLKTFLCAKHFKIHYLI